VEPTLVGREDELGALTGWLAEARAGSSRVVLLGGEAGIGKTRLADELSSLAAGSDVRVAWGRGTEQAGAPPFWPWRQVLERLGHADVLDADPGSVAEPDVERFARFSRVVAVLGASAAPGGLVVVLDDVHQVDLASLRLLVHVAGSIDAAVLVLATHRTSPADHVDGFAETLDALQRLPLTRRLELAELRPAAVAELLGTDPDDASMRAAAARSGGNPLLVGELARHVRAGHDPSSVPPSVRDAVRARLGARSPACARTLTVAALVGREFDAGLVATATDEPALSVLEAIDEASRAGLVEPAERPGRYRFVHALVRDAVEASLGASERPVLHRRIAEAIEAYDGTGDDALPELARHWSAASVLGDREVAAGWCERAADVADRRTAWEEAGRLYDRAAELTGSEADPEARYRRLLGSARARLHCDELPVAVERAMAAAALARSMQRPDLLAETCLIAEARGGAVELMGRLHTTAEEALGSLGDDDHALRARLLGQLATTAFYVDPTAVAPMSVHALAEADAADDPLATIAALRARQMALIEPHHAEERLELAARIGEAGRTLGRATVTQWETIWRIDALLELGRVEEACGELIELRRRVDAVGLPMSRWHLARVEAMLAHATGRFAEAVVWGERARDLFAALEDERGARAIHLSFLLGVQRHTGYEAGTVERVVAFDYSFAPPFLGDLPALAPIQALVGIGDLDGARSRYALLAPPTSWAAPPFLRLSMTVLRLEAAVAIGRHDDLPALIAELERHRGLHVGANGGGVNQIGCVELWLGMARRALGDHDIAVAELRHALDVTSGGATPPLAVQSAAELAGALAARSGPGDLDDVRALVERWRPVGEVLGMTPWVARFDELGGPLGPGSAGSTRDPGPLSPREMEVAGLVARGLTNRQIAAELYLSERTAQNHVQHILTKLGVANRTQIAAWFTAR
jgi:DNA-binding CsgD family transcriptional regulator